MLICSNKLIYSYNPPPLLNDLIHQLQSSSNPQTATPMAAYMRNQFPYLGIKTPEREQLVKSWLQTQLTPSDVDLLAWVQTLYELPEREFQYAACDLLKSRMRHLDPSFWLPQVETFITFKPWWDTVDVWSPKITAGLLKRAPEQIVHFPDQWIHSTNFWLQRAALIFQLNYRNQMDLDRLFHYCQLRMESSEFFVQKAIGWGLRSASRYFPDEVIEFLEREQHSLAPLSLREGSKLLKKKGLW